MADNYRKIVRKDFKGYATTPNPLTQDKDTAQGANWYIDEYGHIVQRPGCQKVTDLSTSDAPPIVYTYAGPPALAPLKFTRFGSLGLFSYNCDLYKDLWTGYGGGTPPAVIPLATIRGGDVNHQRACPELYMCTSSNLFRVVPVIVIAKQYSSNALVQHSMNWENGVLIFRLKVDSVEVMAQTISDVFTFSNLGGAIPGGWTPPIDSYGQTGFLANTMFITDGIANVGVPSSPGAALYIYAHALFKVPTATGLGIGNISSAVSGELHPPLLGFDDHTLSHVTFNDSLFWAGKSHPLMKFNGFRSMMAGVPDLAARAAIQTAPTAIAGVGLNAGTYKYRITFTTYDPNGTVHESTPLDTSVTVGGAVNGFTVTLPEEFVPGGVIPLSHGYSSRSNGRRLPHYNCDTYQNVAGTVLGNGSATVNDLQIGEKVYWWDAATGTTISRMVINGPGSTTAATMFDGTAPPVWPEYFHVGGTWNIYRTVANGSTYYLAKQFAATQTTTALIPESTATTDTVTDATLITHAQYADTAFTRSGAPRVTRHVSVHQTRLVVICRDLSNELSEPGLQNIRMPFTKVAWSEPNSEYFPPSNSLLFSDSDVDIMATASFADTLYILTSKGVWTVSGSLSSAESFTVSKVSGADGCVSSGSVQVVPNGVIYLGSRGFVFLKGMSQTDIRSFNISRPLLPVTIQNEIIGHALPYSGTDYAYKPDLAQSVVVPSKRWYACFVPKPIPSEYTTGEQVFDAIRRGGASALERAFVEPSTINYSPTSNPGVLCVYDFVEDKWFTWTGLDALGGLAVHNDEIYGATRQLNSSSTLKSSLWKLSDYWPKDYTGAINFEYITAWEDLEDPSLLKVFPRMQLFSVKEGQTNSFTLTVTMDKDWAQSSTVSRTITLNGASAPNNEVVALTNQKVKAIRYRFSNSVGTEKPIISGWATEVATENKPNLTDD